MSKKQRSPAAIRQEGFNDHFKGVDFYDNPYNRSTWPITSAFWSEGWKLRERQCLFDSDNYPTYVPVADEITPKITLMECPHCRKNIKVTLE